MPLMDFSYLLGGKGVELDDPLTVETRALTLAELMNRKRLNEYTLKRQEQNDAAADAFNQALPELHAAGYSPEAVNAALRKAPQSSGLMLDAIDKKRKADIDFRKSAAEAAKNETETKLKNADRFGNEANWLADHPLLDDPVKGPAMVSDYMKRIAENGLQGVINPLPFQQWTSPEAARTNLKGTAAAFNDVKDQITQKETNRAHLVTEGLTRDENVDQRRHRLVTEQQGWVTANAAREANQVAREAAKTKYITDVEQKVQNDYAGQSKGFVEAARALKVAKAALLTADVNPSSALAAGTAFMKILDPTSIVRETELGMALNASGWFDRAGNTMKQLQVGKVMTPTQKVKMNEAIDMLWAEMAATQRSIDSQYGDRVIRYGGNPKNVTLDLGQNAPAPAPKASDAASYFKRDASGNLVYTP